MKFLCLAYYDESKWDAMSKADLTALVSQCPAYDAELKKTGCLVAHGSLELARRSAGIRPKGGKPVVKDGPYSEAKEFVGGFFIIEAKDLAEAKQVASKHPAAHLGEDMGWGIEVRPVTFWEQFKQ